MRWFADEFLTASAWSCPGPSEVTAGEETVPLHEVFFARHGGHTRRLPGRDVAVDGAHLVCANPAEPFRLVRRVGVAEAGTVLRIAEPAFRSLLAEYDPRAADRDRPRFPADAVRVTPRTLLAHHALRLEAALGARADSIRLQELALTLLRHAMAPGGIPRPTRLSPEAREAADATRLTLVRRYAERLTLPGLAREVGISPWYLSRLFRAAFGCAIHRYLVRIRLQAALDRLAAGERNLSRVAHDTGFSSHSHFTSAFRRTFGFPPSAHACG